MRFSKIGAQRVSFRGLKKKLRYFLKYKTAKLADGQDWETVRTKYDDKSSIFRNNSSTQ